MNRLIILISLLAFSAVSTFAQNDSIIAKKAFGGYKFEHNGQIVSPKAMLKIMEQNEEALIYMKKAKTNSDISMVLGFSGGFLIGWPIGTAIGGGDPNWLLAGIGAGILIIGIPVAKAATTNALKAVEIYNSSQQSSYFHNGVKLYLGLADHGLGLKLYF
jgi:hypothetical protein